MTRPPIDIDLPDGWALSRIADTFVLNPSKPTGDDLAASSTVTFVPMPAVDASAGAITAPQTRTFEEVRKGFTAFRDGDVIVAKITPCMENGKAAICRGLLNGYGFGSTEFHVLRSTGAALPEYVYHFIRQESFRRDAAENMTGSVGQKRVPAEYLRSAELPLPPLSEQERIVAKVEELLARVNAARERLLKVPLLLKRFRQSVLYAAFTGLLTDNWREKHTGPDTDPALERLAAQRRQEYELLCRKAAQRGERRPKPPTYLQEAEDEAGDLPDLPDLPNAWTWRTIRDAASAMQYGTSVKADAPADRGVPMLRMSNVQDGRIDYTSLKYMAKDGDDWQDFLLREGDIVFNRTNSPELVGKAATFSGTRNVVFASYLVRLTCDTRAALPAFVCYWINSPWGRAWARAVRTDGVSQSNINATKLATMPLPLPTVTEQAEILRRVDGLFALADKIEARLQAGKTRVERITQAVLAEAFRGALVPTEAELARQEGREYEPASVLLERIQGNGPSEHGQATLRSSQGHDAQTEPAHRVDAEPGNAEQDHGERPVPIDQTERDEVLARIRDVFSAGGARSREQAIHDIAEAMGYQRVGSKIDDILDDDIRTAARRGILENTPDGLRLLCRAITDYTRDFLVEQLTAGMGGHWWEREDLIAGTARWLGFRRTGPVIRETLKSAINAAIRRGLLEYDGQRVRRTN